MVTSTKYKLSFTSGGLLVREALIVAPIYLEFQDWSEVRKHIVAENLLQARTKSAGARTARELLQRMSTLTIAELELLAESIPEERNQLMWVATCRQYLFIAEFAEEVLREKFLLLSQELLYSDFDNFLRSKSLWHEELNELKDSTRNKLRTTLFQMLREANLLSNSDQIIQTQVSSRVAAVLAGRLPSELRFFPCTDADFKGAGK